MYSCDVHPDGTRFATAAGDGTVRVWSLGCLFAGKSGHSKNGGTTRRGASSRFTESGNYVSSNSDDYDTASSLEEGRTTSAATGGGSAQQASMQQQQLPSVAPSQPPEGVNDLSGLVRKKKAKGSTSAPPLASKLPATSLVAAASTTAAAVARPAATSSSHPVTSNTTTNNFSNKPTPSNQKRQQPKLLSTISSHEGSVLSLRFSPSGLYLATAGDDSYVNIYMRSKSPSLVKGNLVGVDSQGNRAIGNEGGGNGVGGGGEDVEHWNRIAVCRGHHLDVVGLAWAPDDSHLVSCSLDSANPVIVWRLYDVLVGGENGSEGGGGSVGGLTGMNSSVHIHNLHPFKILGKNVHTSTVKGVAFDPAGKYIATSGDDPAICIWRAFDDWGLEARIDSNSGVFRSKKRKRKVPQDPSGGMGEEDDEEEDDPGELASLSLFRRISFAPDGSHVCGTNASLRGKNIAAMISREGWAASAPQSEANGGGTPRKKDNPPGAANLVGHKQPVVSSRHCPIFFQVPSKGNSDSEESEDDPDLEPEYATLVALGDKRGFVTVWSTKMSRPLFKMQCSESRCTVTDISWGFNRYKGEDSLIMIVSLLDGYVVAINFNIPEEVGGGGILSAEKQRQIFRLKYGIEDFVGTYGVTPGKGRRGKRLVDDVGPMLIENALQLTMEMENDEDEVDDEEEESVESESQTEGKSPKGCNAAETVTTKGGKKRIRAVLINENGDATNNAAGDDAGKKKRKKAKDTQNPLQIALDAAAQASTVAQQGAGAKAARREKASGSGAKSSANQPLTGAAPSRPTSLPPPSQLGPVVRIPCVANKIHSVDLVSKSSSATLPSSILDEATTKIVADCVNSPTAALGGTPATSWPCATLTISRGGVRQWKDIIAKTSCTSLAANHETIAVGTSDGCLYLYGTSATLGFESGKAYRAFPPFVLGSPVAEVNFSTTNDSKAADGSNTTSQMIVVTSDGNFYVYSLLSLGPKLEYKGSIAPAMQHMYLSCVPMNYRGPAQPRLARIQITESNQLMLILVISTMVSVKTLQGFVYNRSMQLWMRVSDSNSFLVSDFYSSLIGLKPHKGGEGILAKVDKFVRSGASSMESAKQMYNKLVETEKQTSKAIVTRSHCEDRLACAIALGSASEFRAWLSLYSRCLSISGDAGALRFLVDVLLGNPNDIDDMGEAESTRPTRSCWWFHSVGSQCLGLDNKEVIRKTILPEMSKNRQLQRLTNEISMELDSL